LGSFVQNLFLCTALLSRESEAPFRGWPEVLLDRRSKLGSFVQNFGLAGGLENIAFRDCAVEGPVGLGSVARKGLEPAEDGFEVERLLAQIEFQAVEEVESAVGCGEFEHAGGFGGADGLEVAAAFLEGPVKAGLPVRRGEGRSGAEAVLEGVLAAAGFAFRGSGAGAFAGVGAVGSDLSGGGHARLALYLHVSAGSKGRRPWKEVNDWKGRGCRAGMEIDDGDCGLGGWGPGNS
jgi:hypothetical protein